MQPYWCGQEWNWQTGRKGRPVCGLHRIGTYLFSAPRVAVKGITNEAVSNT